MFFSASVCHCSMHVFFWGGFSNTFHLMWMSEIWMFYNRYDSYTKFPPLYQDSNQRFIFEFLTPKQKHPKKTVCTKMKSSILDQYTLVFQTPIVWIGVWTLENPPVRKPLGQGVFLTPQKGWLKVWLGRKGIELIWVFPKIGGKPPKWMVYIGKPY